MAREVMGLDLTGFDKLGKKLDGKFAKRLRANVRKAQKRNALTAVGLIKAAIHEGQELAANSAITVAIKGSSRPLVDTGGLVASINRAVPRWDIAYIGVLRSEQKTTEHGQSYDLLNIAFILHEGASIKVTQRMRNYFAMMSRLHPGKWFPIKPSTKVIHIPRRPFLESAVTEAAEKLYIREWNKAIQAAISNRKMR